MPVVELKGSQGPAYRAPMQPLQHVRISGDVLRVIIVDKLEMADGVINEQRKYKEQQRQKLALFFCRAEKFVFRERRRNSLFFCDGGVQS